MPTTTLKRRTRRRAAVYLAGIIALPLSAYGEPDAAGDLSQMSLEQLANVQVTSVSKTAEALRLAPATIYVIGADEIARSGATTIPEALRLAPNLEVRQTSSSAYIVG